jgi:hypothetical protein
MLIELTAVLPIRTAVRTYGVAGSPHMTHAVTSSAERRGEEGSLSILTILLEVLFYRQAYIIPKGSYLYSVHL